MDINSVNNNKSQTYWDFEAVFLKTVNAPFESFHIAYLVLIVLKYAYISRSINKDQFEKKKNDTLDPEL